MLSLTIDERSPREDIDRQLGPFPRPFLICESSLRGVAASNRRRTVSFQSVATPDHGRSARGRIPESGDAMDFPVSRGFNDLVP